MTRGRRLQVSSRKRFLWCLGHQIRRQIRIRHDCLTPAAFSSPTSFSRRLQKGNLVALPGRERDRGESFRTQRNENKQIPAKKINQTGPASVNQSTNPGIQKPSVFGSSLLSRAWSSLESGSKRKEAKKARETKLCTGRTSISPPFFNPPKTTTTLSGFLLSTRLVYWIEGIKYG